MRNLFVDKDNQMLKTDPFYKTGKPNVQFIKDIRRQFWLDLLKHWYNKFAQRLMRGALTKPAIISIRLASGLRELGAIKNPLARSFKATWERGSSFRIDWKWALIAFLAGMVLMSAHGSGQVIHMEPQGIAPAPLLIKVEPIKSLPQTALRTVSEVQTIYIAPVVQTPVNGAPSGCGDNFYANFIYSHESGCRTNAVNPIGACGVGQALPCSKMGCSLSDYACQDRFFTNYALSVYGSWANAYAHWLAHSWW